VGATLNRPNPKSRGRIDDQHPLNNRKDRYGGISSIPCGQL